MATGDHFQLGELNGAGDTTILHGEASEDGSQDFNGKALLIVEPDTSLIRQVKHACHGIMTRGRGAGDGVFAESENGDGVFGSADGATSSGVRGESRNGIGVQGVSRNDNGVVGRSTRAAGVVGSSVSGIGVFGECTAVVTIGVGVQGIAKVANNPSVVGVHGLSSEGRGVVGETDKNTDVEGKSTTGV